MFFSMAKMSWCAKSTHYREYGRNVGFSLIAPFPLFSLVVRLVVSSVVLPPQ